MKPQIQPCRYKTGKTLGAGSYSVVKECVHIDTGRPYAAKVINKRLMQGREHMVSWLLSAGIAERHDQFYLTDGIWF
jgi:serine/threonine protein kinase